MLRISALLVVCLLALFTGPAQAACPSMEGNYVLNLSGFAGGSPVYYPIAFIGNMTIEKDGEISGNYKIIAPITGGTQFNRNIIGKLTLNSKCIGTLVMRDPTALTGRDISNRVLHTFTAIQSGEGVLALATGEVGLVVSGTASK